MKPFRNICILVSIFITLSSCIVSMQALATVPDDPRARNPILPGFYPDPSVVRVGEDFYLVNSSFEWFPSIPIFTSRDLINWKQIGHAVSNPDYFAALNKVDTSRGVYAPTIHYHNGLFYIVSTCVQCGQNFYVTSTDPDGPWSKPIWIEGDRGIDPSFFWDKNGKSYYLGTGILNRQEVTWPNPNGIWIQEIDLVEGTLLGDKTQLTYGHASNARWTEGPHLYLKDGYYYLMVAEGGTSEDHAVTIFRSENILGPYIPNHKNPVLTHRNLGEDVHIHSTGHADMIQTQNGDWYAVMLAKRRFDDLTPLARETFLAQIKWEDGWPVFNPGKARLELDILIPDLPWTPIESTPIRDNFSTQKLSLYYVTLRAQTREWLTIGDKGLMLTPKFASLDEEHQQPSMVVRRIQHPRYSASTRVDVENFEKQDEAGLVIYRNYRNHYKFFRKGNSLQVVHNHKGQSVVIAQTFIEDDPIILAIEDNGPMLSFIYRSDAGASKVLVSNVDASSTSDEVAGGFNGPMIGMYANTSLFDKSKIAQFSWFEYKGTDVH